MNIKQATAKLKKLLGPNFAYRLNRSACKADERKEAHEFAQRAFAEMKKADHDRAARMEALLKADPEYCTLKATTAAWRKEYEKQRSRALHCPITVGVTSSGLFFHVKAEGDNWEEVVEAIEKGKQP